VKFTAKGKAINSKPGPEPINVELYREKEKAQDAAKNRGQDEGTRV